MRSILANEVIWKMTGSLAGFSPYLRVQRLVAAENRFQNKCAQLFAGSVVLDGPFSGLKYPSHAAYGSALYPKLMGFYESELHGVFSQFKSQPYRAIIDVGFAEGYYLVGLAKLFPGAHLWGFDTSPVAHALCADLARANAISRGRLHLAYDATPSSLAPALAGRTLVICDCEGFEAQLFTPENTTLWGQSDIIIECHDFAVSGVTATLTHLLQGTHKTEIISSEEPARKTNLVSAAVRSRFSAQELTRLLNEGRPCRQDWIVASAKSAQSQFPS